MKTIQKSTNILLFVGLVVLTLSGCVKTRQFSVPGGANAIGADATVEVTRQAWGNFSLDIAAVNLLPPQRIAQGITEYVVWVQEGNAQPIRIGTLNYNSSNRKGTMMATTAYTQFQMIMSGEVTSNVASPSEHVVFRSVIETP